LNVARGYPSRLWGGLEAWRAADGHFAKETGIMNAKEQIIIEIAALLRQTPHGFCGELFESLREQLPDLRMTEADHRVEEGGCPDGPRGLN